MVADELTVRPRGWKWGRRFGMRVCFGAARRFGACAARGGSSKCEARSTILRRCSGHESEMVRQAQDKLAGVFDGSAVP